MSFFRRSLRAKFTLVLLVVGVIPLAVASLFFYRTTRDALFRNVFKELKWNAETISGMVGTHFDDTARNLLIASRNTAFTMYFTEPSRRRHWALEQQRTLKYLRSLYPESLDEACFIDATGQEVARIVFDELAPEHELSSDEERAVFFSKAFSLDEGMVYQGEPVISEDTKRWVMPNATPIVVNGKKAAILHFETNLRHMQDVLKSTVNPERGYAFILNNRGEFMAHTQMELSQTASLPVAITSSTPPALQKIFRRMAAGEEGIEQFNDNGKDFFIIFTPIRHTLPLSKAHNDNVWSAAYVISSERVYVEASLFNDYALSAGVTILIVLVVSYTAGGTVTKPLRRLVKTTNKLAGGDMQDTPMVGVDRDDEIGQLAKSFNAMAEAIRLRDASLTALATTDGLTGLYNHRHFKSELGRAIMSAERFNHPLSLIMADIDLFKRYNDSNGHTAGDTALKTVARLLKDATREVDIAARYGGEEFAVILKETTLEQAVAVAERIRASVEAQTIPAGTNAKQRLTLSLGVASFPDGAKDAASLINTADKALYRAKELGRNRVERAKTE